MCEVIQDAHTGWGVKFQAKTYSGWKIGII